MTNPSIPPCPVCDDLKLQLLSTTAYLRDAQKQIAQLNDRLAHDPRVAVLESICEFLARPIAIPTYLSGRGREYYTLDVTEYRSQILKLIAAQRGEVEG